MRTDLAGKGEACTPGGRCHNGRICQRRSGGYGHGDRDTRLEMHPQLARSVLEVAPTVEDGPQTGDRVMAQDVWTVEDGLVHGDRAQVQYARSAGPKPSLNRGSED
ncbi:hypothetical protein VNO78_02832 [Psophocarpus tetragonolobus]|uniref:Uncharacterized protein n=1 Tax=Psophocarpus tetragonolobus TaxID=3891 RepID=A0AAN9T200_PSOTE